VSEWSCLAIAGGYPKTRPCCVSGTQLPFSVALCRTRTVGFASIESLEDVDGEVRFCRYRFCPTGELKYRGAVGLGYRSTYKRTLLFNFKILFVKLYYIGLLKLKAKVAH
jgi:hypothetical protein